MNEERGGLIGLVDLLRGMEEDIEYYSAELTRFEKENQELRKELVVHKNTWTDTANTMTFLQHENECLKTQLARQDALLDEAADRIMSTSDNHNDESLIDLADRIHSFEEDNQLISGKNGMGYWATCFDWKRDTYWKPIRLIEDGNEETCLDENGHLPIEVEDAMRETTDEYLTGKKSEVEDNEEYDDYDITRDDSWVDDPEIGAMD